MSKICGILLCLALVVGCESNDEIADRVIEQREMLKSLNESTIQCVKHKGRKTTIDLTDGRQIVIESIKYDHSISLQEKDKK